MTAQAQASTRGTLLEIRNLHIAFGDGRAADLRSVRCPAQDQAVALEQCVSCAEHGGVVHNEETRSEYVACRHVDTRARVAPPAPRGIASQTPVSAAMTTDVLAVRPDVSLEALTALLLARGSGGAPVVDTEGRPGGVVSKTDLLAERFAAGDTAEAMGPGQHVSRGHYRVEVGPGFHVEALPRFTVADAMTPGAFAISENAPVAQAAALLALHGVHRVPVVSEDGKGAGVVTSSDIVRWLAQRSGYVATRGRVRRPIVQTR